MSLKFTSAYHNGQLFPVYDKEAHSRLDNLTQYSISATTPNLSAWTSAIDGTDYYLVSAAAATNLTVSAENGISARFDEASNTTYVGLSAQPAYYAGKTNELTADKIINFNDGIIENVTVENGIITVPETASKITINVNERIVDNIIADEHSYVLNKITLFNGDDEIMTTEDYYHSEVGVNELNLSYTIDNALQTSNNYYVKYEGADLSDNGKIICAISVIENTVGLSENKSGAIGNYQGLDPIKVDNTTRTISLDGDTDTYKTKVCLEDGIPNYLENKFIDSDIIQIIRQNVNTLQPVLVAGKNSQVLTTINNEPTWYDLPAGSGVSGYGMISVVSANGQFIVSASNTLNNAIGDLYDKIQYFGGVSAVYGDAALTLTSQSADPHYIYLSAATQDATEWDQYYVSLLPDEDPNFMWYQAGKQNIKLDDYIAKSVISDETEDVVYGLSYSANPITNKADVYAVELNLASNEGKVKTENDDTYDYLFDKFVSVTVNANENTYTAPNSTLDETMLQHRIKFDETTLSWSPDHVLSVKLAKNDDDSGLVTNEQVQELLAKFNSRITETIPLGSITDTEPFAAGASLSYLFRPTIDYELDDNTKAHILTANASAGNTIVSVAIYKVVGVGAEIELIWTSAAEVLTTATGEHTLGSSKNYSGVLKTDELYYVVVTCTGQQMQILGIKSNVFADMRRY